MGRKGNGKEEIGKGGRRSGFGGSGDCERVWKEG